MIYSGRFSYLGWKRFLLISGSRVNLFFRRTRIWPGPDPSLLLACSSWPTRGLCYWRRTIPAIPTIPETSSSNVDGSGTVPPPVLPRMVKDSDGMVPTEFWEA